MSKEFSENEEILTKLKKFSLKTRTFSQQHKLKNISNTI